MKGNENNNAHETGNINSMHSTSCIKYGIIYSFTLQCGKLEEWKNLVAPKL